MDLIPEAVPQPTNTWKAITKTNRNSKYDWKTNLQPDESSLKLEYSPPKPVPVKTLTPKVRNDLAAQRPSVEKPKTLNMQAAKNVSPADTKQKQATDQQKSATLVVKPTAATAA